MKKKRLKINELKLESYLTEMSPDLAETAKGGTGTITSMFQSNISYCPTLPPVNDQSWFPYENAPNCQKTTTTTTTTTQSVYIYV